MKIKGVDRTANTAWSPRHQYPIYLAVGTAAQQLDASFSTTAALELFSLNLSDPGFDLGLRSSVQSEHRFHKLTWGTHGQSSGTIVGGCDGGVIQIYNSEKLLNGENSLISQQTKHKGAVRALDFNSFQSNLLASAAAESEIYIWDLNNPKTPMTPGAKCQPLEDVTSLAWNKQVQHILASTFQTKCVVWDLRKNDPIIKLTDTTIRIKWHAVAWNPDIATQLCLGSEDDQNSVIQLWDLRFATAPLKVFDNHQKGVLSISWCHQDTDMLLSCGRDNKIICWNANNNVSGFDINCEFILTNQWNFDVSWCPRNPALFACSSFDGHVGVYSLLGSPQQVETSNKIADSFPGMELYAQAPISQTHSVLVELKKSPKWLKKPVGAKFGFGGKLVSFENVAKSNAEISHSRQIHISQIVTEEELLSKSCRLESALESGQLVEFCREKISESDSTHEKMIWQFLEANFKSFPRSEFLNLLGFRGDELNKKLAAMIDKIANGGSNEISKITNKISALGRSTDSESDLDGFDGVLDQSNFSPENVLSGSERNETNFSSSVKCPLSNYKISAGDDLDGLICQALILGNVEAAVDLCLKDNRMADAIVLAMTGGSELLAKTQYIYFQQNPGYLSSLISAVVTEDWSQIVKNCSIESWKEALAGAITYSNEQEFSVLCEMLGERLENEKDKKLSENAEICYICAGNPNKVVSLWSKRDKTATKPDKLQKLVEFVTVFKKSLELRGSRIGISGRLATLFTNYAGILVSQGCIETALSYLGDSDDDKIVEMKDRLIGSLGGSQKYAQGNPSTNHVSSQPQVQRSRTVSAGFYPPTTVQENVVTAPPISQHNFNLNPLQSGVAPQSFTPTPYVPVPPLTPGSVVYPPLQSVAPPFQSVAPPLQSVAPPLQSVAPPIQSVAPPLQSVAPPLQSVAPPQQSVPPPSRAFPSPSPGPGGLTSRSKHVLDPSVQSATSHSGYFSQNQPPVYASQQPILSTQNYGFNSGGYSAEAFNPPPANPTPPPPPQSTATAPKSSSGPQPPGWNDPPVVEAAKRFAKNDFVQQSPITQPLFGGPTGDTLMGNPMYDPYQNSHLHHPPPVPNQFQSGPQLPYPTHQCPPSATVQGMAMPKPMESMPAAIETVKKPIPEEHAVLRDVFDGLRNKCMMAANNPQSKRKLEEVTKKLEVLYDGLRDGRLSSNTLQALHLIARHVQSGEYTNGLMLHTQLVSGPDFSQIAGFMPGIKILLQSALQLQVYL